MDRSWDPRMTIREEDIAVTVQLSRRMTGCSTSYGHGGLWLRWKPFGSATSHCGELFLSAADFYTKREVLPRTLRLCAWLELRGRCWGYSGQSSSFWFIFRRLYSCLPDMELFLAAWSCCFTLNAKANVVVFDVIKATFFCQVIMQSLCSYIIY